MQGMGIIQPPRESTPRFRSPSAPLLLFAVTMIGPVLACRTILPAYRFSRFTRFNAYRTLPCPK
ncbi:hypothetical protein K445DRAFT_320659 [Daldinia sp. EC12]|nr:hypothetical protein K445DRAFT_320659 [Daldinia sp. EC12]